MAEKVILNESDIRRAILRIAHEIVERNRGAENLVLVGLQTRGVPLARRIVTTVRELEDVNVPLGELDFTLYRDDLSARGYRPRIGRSDIPVDVTGKRVVLVDDVLYTGRSVRAALDALIDYGRPQSIQLAVLIDRGHRELPIRADYVGKNVPTASDEDVQVRLAEVDGRDEVAIQREE